MNSRRPIAAFTLLELLVVISIMGIVAALAVPAIKTFGRSNAVTTATRQMMDDVAQARQRAIATRTDVYLVFVPPSVPTFLGSAASFRPADRYVLTNLQASQYSGYALFASHQVGDQPGRPTARYLTSWRTLPEGTFIAANKFGGANVNGVSPFQVGQFPFPSSDSPVQKPLPYIRFNYQGQVVGARDGGTEIIPLARGSVLAPRDGSGPASVLETPPANSITISNHIRIDGLTGRARVERLQVQ